MQYTQFIFESLNLILSAYCYQTIEKDSSSLRSQYQSQTPQLIFVQIFAYCKLQGMKIKLEQWKFLPISAHPNLQKSYSIERSNDNEDSELSFSQLNQSTFFKTLESIRKNITPKIILKKLQLQYKNPKILCEIKKSQNQLVPFSNQNTFYSQIGQFESQYFQAKLSFKYNYDYDGQKQQIKGKVSVSEDSDQFQLLVDESYQRALRKQKNQFMLKDKESSRRWSEDVLSPKKQFQSNKLVQKDKKNQQMNQLETMLNKMDFSFIQSSKIKTFMAYL